MLSKGVLRAIWLEKNHCWREFVTFYYAFLESHSLPHHNFSQVQRSFLLWNIYSTLVPLPGEREIDTLLRILLATLTIVKLSACLFVCLFSKGYVIEFQDLCYLVFNFKGPFLTLCGHSEMKRPVFTKLVEFWQRKKKSTFAFLFSYKCKIFWYIILDKIYLFNLHCSLDSEYSSLYVLEIKGLRPFLLNCD